MLLEGEDMNGTVTVDRTEEVVAMVQFALVTIFSLLGMMVNGYVVAVLVLTRQYSTTSTKLVLHLGGVGVVSSILTLVGRAVCACGGLQHLILAGQVWAVCALNVDRTISIVKPLHYEAIVPPEKVMAGLASGWLIIMILLSPVAAGQPPLDHLGKFGFCSFDCGASYTALAFCSIYTLATLLAPTTLVIYCCFKILIIVYQSRENGVASAIVKMAVPLAQMAAFTHQKILPRPSQKSALKEVLHVLGALATLYFPFYFVVIWRAFAIPPQVLAAVSAILLAAAPFINGLYYGIKNKTLKDFFRNQRRKFLSRSEVSQEIQARTPSCCGSRRPSMSVSSGTIRRQSDAAAMGNSGSEPPAPRAASCNRLQESLEEPRARSCAIPIVPAPPHVALARLLRLDGKPTRERDSHRSKSPCVITVTRAMSAEQESPTRQPLCRQHSRSSDALLGTSHSCDSNRSNASVTLADDSGAVVHYATVHGENDGRVTISYPP